MHLKCILQVLHTGFEIKKQILHFLIFIFYFYCIIHAMAHLSNAQTAIYKPYVVLEAL